MFESIFEKKNMNAVINFGFNKNLLNSKIAMKEYNDQNPN